MLAQPLGAAGLAGVTVLLLIRPVKLEQRLVLVVELGRLLLQLLGDVAAQRPAVFLDDLGAGALGRLGAGRRLVDRGGVGGHDGFLHAPEMGDAATIFTKSISKHGPVKTSGRSP